MKGSALWSVLALAIVGCGRGSPEGVKPDVQKSLNALNDLAKKSNGNFDQLSPQDKATVVQDYGGDETSARKRFSLIDHVPKQGAMPNPKR